MGVLDLTLFELYDRQVFARGFHKRLVVQLCILIQMQQMLNALFNLRVQHLALLQHSQGCEHYHMLKKMLGYCITPVIHKVLPLLDLQFCFLKLYCFLPLLKGVKSSSLDQGRIRYLYLLVLEGSLLKRFAVDSYILNMVVGDLGKLYTTTIRCCNSKRGCRL